MGENFFAIVFAILGLVLFGLLIGDMHVGYLSEDYSDTKLVVI